MKDESPALEIVNLRVDYGSFTAVSDLSLTLPRGEIFGLAGPNGAGKTSTIRVLASLLEPTYGEVRILGRDLFEDPEGVRERLGYMPDLAPVVPNLKVWEFLDLYAQSHGLRGGEKRDRVDACLAQVKLDDKRNVYGRALSRGMTQRVVLAKTLLHEPKLLLLDEPASGMDPIARRGLRRILQALAADGATVLVSSHILSELSDLCTSVGIMHLGRLLEHGPKAEVVDSMLSDNVVVQVELVDGVDTAVSWLGGHDGVDAIRVEGRRIGFSFEGGKEAQAGLLAAMVSAGIDVVSFSPTQTGIESRLMDLIGDDAQ